MSESWGQPPQQGGYQQGPPQQQGWGQPPQQQGWGQQGPPPGAYGQPAQQSAAPVADFGNQEFFSRVGGQAGGVFGPSFKWENAPDYGVLGVVVGEPQVVAKTQTDGKPRTDKNGAPLWQLAVTLQTNLRNWACVSRVPTNQQPGPQNGQPLPPSEDTGLRTIYLWYTLRDAVEAAVLEAGRGYIEEGWELGVKVTELLPNPKGRDPIRQYKAIYRPATGAVQAAPPAQQQGPPPQQQYAPPAQQQGPPPQQQYAPPAQQSPPVQQGPPPQQQYAPPAQQQGPPPQGGQPYQGDPPF